MLQAAWQRWNILLIPLVDEGKILSCNLTYAPGNLQTSDVFLQILESDFEPFGVIFGMLPDVVLKLGKVHVFP